MLTMVRKINVGILVDKLRRMTGVLIGDEQGGFRAGKGCVYQIFTLKQIGEKAQKKNKLVYVSFIELEITCPLVFR